MKRISKRIVSACLIVVLVLIVIPTGKVEAQQVQPILRTGLKVEFDEPEKMTDNEFEKLEEKITVHSYSSADQNYWMQFSSDYYYSRLTQREKEAWNELETLCLNYLLGSDTSERIQISQSALLQSESGDVDSIFEFIQMFRYAHPQFYFLQNYYGTAYREIGGDTYYYPYIYVYSEFCDPSYRSEVTQQFSAKIDKWLSQIRAYPENKVEQREKAAHDIVCENTEYASNDYDQSAYSMVCLGETVCAGYAATLNMLLNAVGIETVVVTSYDHAWNLTNLHGIWYEVDSTWADQDSYIYYAYYNKSQETYEKGSLSHTAEAFWDEYQPEAKYDSFMGQMYQNPYFDLDNYTYFIINENTDLGAMMVGAVSTKNGALYKDVPALIVGANGITYQTMSLYEDPDITAPAEVAGLQIAGRAPDALRINWNKSDDAQGYILEQMKDGNWVRIARIADPNTTTYRVEQLDASTVYQFRIKSFVFNDAGQALYSDYQTVSGKTTPSAVGEVKIAGWAQDALRIHWNKNASVSGYIIEQNQNGSWIRIARIADPNTTTYRVEELKPSTTYQFRMRAFDFDGSTALYGTYQNVSGRTAPTNVTGVVIGGRAGDALRINWNKNESVSGYIIEQYQNGSWVRIARIADKNTTTYRITGLLPSTTYQFRIRAFDFDGNTALYGGYTSASGKTNPAAIKGLEIGGRAYDALRLNWDRDAAASGYIVEQNVNGKWVRIARIGNNTTTTYRVEGLNRSTTYQFRVYAFGFDGNTPTYGGAGTISGTTY